MTQSAAAIAAQRAPSVLVVLVVRDAAGWLRESLSALAAQTYPRLAVMAVDNASTDGSAELLVHALGDGRVVALARGPRSGRRAGRRANASRGERGRLPPAPARRRRARPRGRHPDGRGRRRTPGHGPGGRGGGEGRRLGRSPPAPRRGSLRRSLRPSVLAVAAGRDRPGPVRPRARGAVRVVVRHVGLPRGVAARGAVRRAHRRRVRGSGLLLARQGRRVPRADDAPGSRAAPRGVRGGRSAHRATSQRPLRRGPLGDHGHAEELLAAESPVGAAARARARRGSPGVPAALAPVRRGVRSAGGVGMERRAPAGHGLAPSPGSEGAPGRRSHAPSLHGVGGPPAPSMVRDRGADPRPAGRHRRGRTRAGAAPSARAHRVARRDASRHGRLVPRRARRGGGHAQPLGIRGSGRRGASRLPRHGVGLLRRDDVGVPHHGTGRIDGRQSGVGWDGRLVRPAVRQHRAGAEGDGGRLPPAGGHPHVPGVGSADEASRPLGDRRGRLRGVLDRSVGACRRAGSGSS